MSVRFHLPRWLRLWPSAEEWRSWKLLDRLGYFGFIMGVIGLILAIVPFLQPEKKAVATDLAPEEKIAAEARLRDDEVLPGLDREQTRQLRELLSDPATMSQARVLLEEIRSSKKTAQAIDSINGLIVATYFGQKQYRDGLTFLCKLTEHLPRTDYRWRFQFHANIRAIAAQEGRKAAEQAVADMRKRCKRAELSKVWIGVPLRMMEALHRGSLVEDDDWRIADSDRLYLTTLASTAPGEPFIDHAWYFLGDYRKVIDGDPKSLIRDTALRADAVRNADCRPGNKCDVETVLADLTALERIEPARLRQTARQCAGRLASAGRLDDAYRVVSLACHSDCDHDLDLIVEGAQDGKQVTLQQVTAWLAATSPARLASWEAEDTEGFDRSSDAVEKGDYQTAQSLLDGYIADLAHHKLAVPPSMRNSRRIIVDLIKAAERPDAQRLFNLGLKQIDSAGDYSESKFLLLSAIGTFLRVERSYPTSDFAPRASYLRAATYRHLGDYDKAIVVVDEFLKRYPPAVPLYDDMLAERGVHDLLVENDWERARSIFEAVVRRFPNRNAADNALNWMAWELLNRCHYDEAFQTYSRLAKSYPANRLGLRAIEQVAYMQPLMKSRGLHIGIPGLRLGRGQFASVTEVDANSVAERSGFELDDVITAINGVAVTDAASVYALLQHMEPGRSIDVSVDFKKPVQTTVDNVVFFEKNYGDDSCGQ